MTTFRELEAFVAVVDTGSFDKAARSLGTSQSAVSRLISEFEGGFQQPLFNRDQRSVRLTMAGQEVLRVARVILQHRASLSEKFGNADLLAPTLRLGVSELAAITWLGRFVARLHARYENMRIELQVNASPVLHEQLRDRQLDIAIVGDVVRSTDMARIPVGTANFGWYCAPELPIPDKLSQSDFESQTLLLQDPNTGAGAFLAEWLIERGIRPANIIKTDSLAALAGICAARLGLAILPRAVAMDPVAKGVLREVELPLCAPVLNYIALVRIDTISAFHRIVIRLAQESCDFNTPFQVVPSRFSHFAE